MSCAFSCDSVQGACIFLQLNEHKSEFIMFGNKMPGNDLIESYGLLSNNSHVKNQ